MLLEWLSYLELSLELISHLCCEGTVVHVLAMSTMASASITPKPKLWLTGKYNNRLLSEMTIMNTKTWKSPKRKKVQTMPLP